MIQEVVAEVVKLQTKQNRVHDVGWKRTGVESFGTRRDRHRLERVDTLFSHDIHFGVSEHYADSKYRNSLLRAFVDLNYSVPFETISLCLGGVV